MLNGEMEFQQKWKCFAKIEKHERGNNKPERNKDGEGWRRLTQITNDELEKPRLNFSRRVNRDAAPLTPPPPPSNVSL